MSLRVSAAIAAITGVAVLVTAAPAHAIETRDLGLTPVQRVGEAGRQSLRIGIEPGSTTTDAVRVWNKTNRAITVDVSATAAKLESDGSVALGGDARPASWIEIDEHEFTLAPNGSKVVQIEIHAPDQLPARETTAAVMVQPVAEAGDEPAVLQRVAVMAYLSADTLVAPPSVGNPVPMWLVVVAMAAAVVVAVPAVRRARRFGVGGPQTAAASS